MKYCEISVGCTNFPHLTRVSSLHGWMLLLNMSRETRIVSKHLETVATGQRRFFLVSVHHVQPERGSISELPSANLTRVHFTAARSTLA